uniref:Mitochondrial enolase superfamily member 1-like n=1 Tax=Diabrotica virgifera virgifera TaxID=50390 RepID=A0A6P7G1K9_DIAVI
MSKSLTGVNLKIVSLDVKDVRFPTSLQADGSDAMHTDPDYSCAYVTIKLQSGLEGYGLTFTCGRGTEVIVAAVESLKSLVVGQVVTDIYKEFGVFWRSLTSESQIRWVSRNLGLGYVHRF